MRCHIHKQSLHRSLSIIRRVIVLLAAFRINQFKVVYRKNGVIRSFKLYTTKKIIPIIPAILYGYIQSYST